MLDSFATHQQKEEDRHGKTRHPKEKEADDTDSRHGDRTAASMPRTNPRGLRLTREPEKLHYATHAAPPPTGSTSATWGVAVA